MPYICDDRDQVRLHINLLYKSDENAFSTGVAARTQVASSFRNSLFMTNSKTVCQLTLVYPTSNSSNRFSV